MLRFNHLHFIVPLHHFILYLFDPICLKTFIATG